MAATLVDGSKSQSISCPEQRSYTVFSYRDQRLAIKSELSIRAKALSNSEFPSQAIIDEFLIRPVNLPKLDLKWKQPNVIKFLVLFLKFKGERESFTSVYIFAEFYDKTAAME